MIREILQTIFEAILFVVVGYVLIAFLVVIAP